MAQALGGKLIRTQKDRLDLGWIHGQDLLEVQDRNTIFISSSPTFEIRLANEHVAADITSRIGINLGIHNYFERERDSVEGVGKELEGVNYCLDARGATRKQTRSRTFF